MSTKRETPLPAVRVGGDGRQNALRLDAILPHLRNARQLPSGEWVACCPAHADSNPSLSLRELPDGTLLWHCHAGCGQQKVGEALRKLAGVDAPQRRRSAPRTGLTLEQYAEYRRLPIEKLREFGLSDGRRNSAPAVRIPYRDFEGREVSVQWRVALGGTDRFRRDGSPCLYGLWCVPQYSSEYIMLVEGVSDAHVCWTADLQAVALPSADHRASVEQFWAEVAPRFEQVYLVPDRDEAGAACLRLLSATCPPELRARTQVVQLPCKDLGDLWLGVDADPAQFRAQLPRLPKLPLPEPQAGEPPAQADRREELVLTPVRYDELEVDYAVPILPSLLYEGRVTLLAGAAGTGKTVMCAELVNAIEAGEPVWGIPLPRLRVLWLGFDQPFEQVKEYFETYYGSRPREIYALPEDLLYPLTPQTYVAYRDLLEREAIGLAVIDTLADWLVPSDSNDEVEIREKMALVRRLARETGCCILATAHTNKEAEWRGDASVTAVSGSTRFAGGADVVAVVRFDSKAGEDVVRLTVPKARGGARWSIRLARRNYRFVPVDENELPRSEWRVVKEHLQQVGEADYDALLEVLTRAGFTLSREALKRRLLRWSQRGLVVLTQRGFPRKAYASLPQVRLQLPVGSSEPYTPSNDPTDPTDPTAVKSSATSESANTLLSPPYDPTDPADPTGVKSSPPAVGSVGSVGSSGGGQGGSDPTATHSLPCAESDTQPPCPPPSGDGDFEALLQAWVSDPLFGLEPEEAEQARLLWQEAHARNFPALRLNRYAFEIPAGREAWLQAIPKILGTPAVECALALLRGEPEPPAESPQLPPQPVDTGELEARVWELAQRLGYPPLAVDAGSFTLHIAQGEAGWRAGIPALRKDGLLPAALQVLQPPPVSDPDLQHILEYRNAKGESELAPILAQLWELAAAQDWPSVEYKQAHRLIATKSAYIACLKHQPEADLRLLLEALQQVSSDGAISPAPSATHPLRPAESDGARLIHS